jgi:hypothetical protein
MPGLTARLGAAMAEGASVCLDDCGHGVPVRLIVDGGESNVTPFAGKSRLEVSGIRRGDPRSIAARVNRKKRQMSRSGTRLPGIVVVVEFSTPLARVLDQ